MRRTRQREKAVRATKYTHKLSVAQAVQLGIELQQKGDAPGAAEIYRGILKQRPENVDALHFLGIAEHQQGNHENALKLLERALALCPDHPDLHNNKGNILKRQGSLEAAEMAYERVLQLRPNDANALNNIGMLARQRGEPQRALDVLRKALEMQPTHYEAHLNLGYVLRDMNRFEEAIDIHKRAMLLRPQHSGAYRELGAVYYVMGRIEEAAAIYRLWLEREPGHPVATHMLAACTGAAVPNRASDAFVRESFDGFASHFDESLAKLKYRAPELVAEAVQSATREVKPSLDVLDLGCGTGLCAPHLRPNAKRLIGVDLSERMLEKAKTRNLYDQLVCAELTAYLSGCTSNFDLMVSADTLVYFGELDVVMHAISAKLRQGGKLIFTVESDNELDAPQGFRLNPHGRYSHTESYVRRALAGAALDLCRLVSVELRLEATKPVRGFLVTASQSGDAAP